MDCCFSYFRLALAEDEVRALRSKAGLLTDYETQVRRLRDDIALLTARRDSLYRVSSGSVSMNVKDDHFYSPPLKEEKSKDKAG